MVEEEERPRRKETRARLRSCKKITQLISSGTTLAGSRAHTVNKQRTTRGREKTSSNARQLKRTTLRNHHHPDSSRFRSLRSFSRDFPLQFSAAFFSFSPSVFFFLSLFNTDYGLFHSRSENFTQLAESSATTDKSPLTGRITKSIYARSFIRLYTIV